MEGMSLHLLSLSKPTVSSHSVVWLSLSCMTGALPFSNARAALLSPAQLLQACKAVPSVMHGSIHEIITLYTVCQYFASAFSWLTSCLLLFQIDSVPGSPRSHYAQSDMDIDAASANSHAPDDSASGQQLSGYAAAHQNLQPDPNMQSVTSPQSHQPDHQQHQHLLLTRDAQTSSHVASAAASASQGVSNHGHAAESTPAQQTGMSHSFASSAAQVPGSGSGTTQMPGFAGSQVLRQGTATGARHSHGEEEEQSTVSLQHASSTSAMLSLAQQASQASWASQQQAAKRHSRHTGQCFQAHNVPCSLIVPSAC